MDKTCLSMSLEGHCSCPAMRWFDGDSSESAADVCLPEARHLIPLCYHLLHCTFILVQMIMLDALWHASVTIHTIYFSSLGWPSLAWAPREIVDGSQFHCAIFPTKCELKMMLNIACETKVTYQCTLCLALLQISDAAKCEWDSIHQLHNAERLWLLIAMHAD